MTVYRYKLTTINIRAIQKSVVASISIVDPLAPANFIDVVATLVGDDKDNLDEAMLRQGYTYYSTDPITTLQQDANTTNIPPRHTGVVLAGLVNGSNQTFTSPVTFVSTTDETISVFYNGMRLSLGIANDFTLSESGGVGTGFDTVFLLFSPKLGDVITADFTAA